MTSDGQKTVKEDKYFIKQADVKTAAASDEIKNLLINWVDILLKPIKPIVGRLTQTTSLWKLVESKTLLIQKLWKPASATWAQEKL